MESYLSFKKLLFVFVALALLFLGVMRSLQTIPSMEIRKVGREYESATMNLDTSKTTSFRPSMPKFGSFEIPKTPKAPVVVIPSQTLTDKDATATTKTNKKKKKKKKSARIKDELKETATPDTAHANREYIQDDVYTSAGVSGGHSPEVKNESTELSFEDWKRLLLNANPKIINDFIYHYQNHLLKEESWFYQLTEIMLQDNSQTTQNFALDALDVNPSYESYTQLIKYSNRLVRVRIKAMLAAYSTDLRYVGIMTQALKDPQALVRYETAILIRNTVMTQKGLLNQSGRQGRGEGTTSNSVLTGLLQALKENAESDEDMSVRQISEASLQEIQKALES